MYLRDSNNYTRIEINSDTTKETFYDASTHVFRNLGGTITNTTIQESGMTVAVTAMFTSYIKFNSTNSHVSDTLIDLGSAYGETARTCGFGVADTQTIIARGSGGLKITSTTDSTGTSTGALIVGGGVGIMNNVHVGGTITDNSDDRLKHNETDISNALQHIRDLHPQHYIKTYEMYEADHHFNLDASGQPIDSSGNVVRHLIEEGLIAQDLLQIDAFKPFVSVPTDPITKPYGVNYNSIFVHAIAALQELDAEHTKTKTELEQTKQSLTETISNLESLLQSALSRILALETNTTT